MWFLLALLLWKTGPIDMTRRDASYRSSLSLLLSEDVIIFGDIIGSFDLDVGFHSI